MSFSVLNTIREKIITFLTQGINMTTYEQNRDDTNE